MQQIEANFLSIIEITEASKIKLILCSILPVSEYYWNKKIQPLEKLKALNTFLASLSNNTSIFYLDFYTALEKNDAMNKLFSEDGVHPNLAGYNIMSDILINSNYF